MIRIKHAILFGAALLMSACERCAGGYKADAALESSGNSNATVRQAHPSAEENSSAQRPEARSAAAAAELAKAVLEKKDMMVNGEPACALTVRYGEGLEQPVTWRGESCRKLLVRLASIEDLRRIGQDTKLGGETLEDLARMPGRRALYLEGGHSSAIYPENVMHRIYEVPLAD